MGRINNVEEYLERYLGDRYYFEGDRIMVLFFILNYGFKKRF